MKKIWNQSKKHLIVSFIVALIVMLVFLVKGIYPFGRMTIANGDLGQAYIPFYYFLYDICHGSKTVFYDYVLGMGSNTYGGFIVDGLLNPTSYVVLLNSRDMIPYMMSFVLVLKLAVVGFTSSILFFKINQKHPFYNYLFGVLYALSAYNLMYYTNLMWLDVVALFPILILTLKRMFDENKIYSFSIVLALILIFNFNLAYMVLLFLIFVVPIYIHFGMEKKDRKKAAFNLIIGILLSVGLSSFAFIPSLMQTLHSYRMSGDSTFDNTAKNIHFFYKLGCLSFYSLPVYFYVKGATSKKSKNKNIFKMLSIALIVCAGIPIIFERVNLWWHTGSYQEYPFRYGFIPTILLYIGALYYVNEMKLSHKEGFATFKKLPIIMMILLGTSLLCLCGYTAIYINHNLPASCFVGSSFCLVAGIFILSILFYHILLQFKNSSLNQIAIAILTFVVVFSYCWAYIGVDVSYRFHREISDDGDFYANEIYHVLQSDLYRMRDLSLQQYENSPEISNVPSMSTFLHLISTEQALNAKQLGYSAKGTKLNDFGGTIFTDAIYGVRYIISPYELPDSIYHFIKMNGDYYIYEYRMILPFGVVVSDSPSSIPSEYHDFDAHNYLYHEMFHSEEDIIDVSSYSATSYDNKLSYSLMVDGERELYLYLPESVSMKYIKLNGEKMTIPIHNDVNNMEYPTEYNNGILDLGYFKDQEVLIEMEVGECTEDYAVRFGMLDLEKYFHLNDDAHSMQVQVSKNKILIDGDSSLNAQFYLPINYDDGFKSNVELHSCYNTFLCIPISEGENHIQVTFIPKYFSKCVIVTIGTILLMLLLFFIRKYFDIRNISFIMTIFWIFGLVILVALTFKFYVISIIQTFLN